MLLLVWALLLVAVFAACLWSGGTLARHYNDGPEVGAALLIGFAVLGAFALATHTSLPDGPFAIGLIAVAAAGGLVTGYARSE
jgi:hypothetical protein